jgi:hypothetical protein
VDARDLVVPDERDVVVGAAADRDARGVGAELGDHLAALAVAVEQERDAAPLGGQARLELGRCRRVRIGELSHRPAGG